MPSPPTTKSHLNSLPRRPLAVIAALSTTLAAAGVAVADCPDTAPEPAEARQSPPNSTSASLDSDINLQVDDLDATRNGEWHLNGNVTISQGERRLKTRDATYDPAAETFSTEHEVEYSDPTVKVQGSAAQFDPAGGANFEDAKFQLRGQPAQAQAGRGEAGRINVTQQGKLNLDGVRYTTCPAGNDDWILKASDIDINQQSSTGTGRNVRLDFMGIPILYTPFISFPIGNERKSGFLIPDFGTSSRSGTALVIPWYWNIAPNYDATFGPTWYSKRGGKLDAEFRYLTEFGHGNFNGEYLPDDKEFGDSRSLLRFVDQSDFTEQLRLDIDAANASDSDWFEDFGMGPEGTSVSYLNRLANLSYLSEHWFASALAQNFQTIDDDPQTGIAVADRPYTLLPQFAVRANFPGQPYGITLGMDGEWSNFRRNTGVLGTRFDVAPEMRMPLRGAGIYLEPAVSWRYTKYELDDIAPGADTAPSRSTPLYSLDGGMILERASGSKGQRLQTVEPRFMYLYVPYRDQRDLPVFDTNPADLNLVQLFRTNRYVGADRLSNANQMSVGLTSRLFDADTGQQFIAGTIGQSYYFDPPRAETALPGEVLPDTQSSDLVAELDVTAFRNWNIRMGVAWDPGDMRSEKGDVHLQYRPAHDRVMNLGYRFRRDIIEQVDGSVAWPLGDQWSIYGRMVYSLEDTTQLDQAGGQTTQGNTALDKFAGLEYRSCCWRVRFVARRYVSNRLGDIDTSFLVQLELNGLSSVGVPADAFLERSIRGYSSRPPQP